MISRIKNVNLNRIFRFRFSVIMLTFSILCSCYSTKYIGKTGRVLTEKVPIGNKLVCKVIDDPTGDNPKITFQLGKIVINKKIQKYEYRTKVEASLLAPAMIAIGGGALYFANWDKTKKRDEQNNAVEIAAWGTPLALLAWVLFVKDTKKEGFGYEIKEICEDDWSKFYPLPKTDINISTIPINKSWKITTDENGVFSLNLLDFLESQPLNQNLLVNFKLPNSEKIDYTINADIFQKIREYLVNTQTPFLKTQLQFSDDESIFPNKILDGSEKAYLNLKIENSGKGKAFDVEIQSICENKHIEMINRVALGDIEPNQSKSARIPLKVDANAIDGRAIFTIQSKEKRGYDARPVQLQIPVRHLDKPALSFISFTLNDGTSGLASGNGNGIVENGETVEITAFVKNTGVGASLNTTVNVNSVSPGAEIRQGKVRLGTIAPSETKQAKVVVAIPRTYSGSDLRLAFAARDTIGASQITKEHILPMSKLTPILAFDSRFLDSRGVQVDEVSNGSSYILEIMPRNEGQIAARSVQANVTASAGVTISNPFFAVGDMAAGASAAPIRFNFALPRNYNYGIPQFNLRLSQSDFADINQKLDIPFRLKSPNLIAREVVTTTDGNVDIQQSETVDIDIVVENQGDLDAENVVADLNFTHTGIDFRERTKTLGRIPAGGQGRARFSFLVKTGATVGPLVGQLQVRQADGFAPVTKTLNYTINAIGAQIVIVTPNEQTTAMQRVTPVLRANTPPVVFLSLKNLGAEGKSYEPYVKLEIQIKDDKPLLAIEPEIRVNGRLQPKEQGLRGIGLEEREAKEDELKIKMYRLVELSEGFNDIEIRVYDADNEMGMETTQVEYVPQRTDIWAIIIGVGDYQNDQIDDLKFAAADAQSFYDFIRSPEGGNLQADHVKFLLNRDANRENILRDMEWITSKAFENDVVYIYMALHGMVNEGELYFLAHDSDPRNLLATGVKKTELENLLQRRMKSNKIVWFADACHSGSLGEDTQVSMRASRASATNRLLTEISKARNGLAMLMSATAAEYSQGGIKWGGGHGVFTHFLLQGLRGQADRNKDNFVSVPELYDYVSRQVSEATEGKQNPILRGNYDRELKLSTVK